MITRLVLAVGLVFLTTGPAAAGVDPADTCRDKKGKEVGKYALNILKAHGKNGTSPDAGELAADISKSRSKLTKGFNKAEFTGAGQPKGCATTGDVGALETKVDTFVDDVLEALPF